MSDPMPNNDEQLHALLATVERLRGERFPHLDAALVRELLLLHADPSFGRADLARGVEQAVERHLAEEG